MGTIAQMSEAVGILQRLSAPKMEDALELLRTLSMPGIRYKENRLVYSAAFLEPQETTNERLDVA